MLIKLVRWLIGNGHWDLYILLFLWRLLDRNNLRNLYLLFGKGIFDFKHKLLILTTFIGAVVDLKRRLNLVCHFDNLWKALFDVYLVDFCTTAEQDAEIFIGSEADLIFILIEIRKGIVDWSVWEALPDEGLETLVVSLVEFDYLIFWAEDQLDHLFLIIDYISNKKQSNL